MLNNIYLFICTLIAYFVKGITGFGNTLVMGSLFSFVVANRQTTPIDLLLSIPTNAYMAWKDRKSISLKIVAPLALLLIAGIIPGTWLLKFGNDWILKSLLGIVVVGMAVEMLTRKPPQGDGKKLNPVFLIAIGLISGVLAGLYGIGALLVAYISRTTDNRSQFRANLCCVFLVENLFRFFSYWVSGILTKELLLMALCLTPAVVIGMFVGNKIDARMNEKSVRNSIIILLIVSGTVLFLTNILHH